MKLTRSQTAIACIGIIATAAIILLLMGRAPICKAALSSFGMAR